MKKEQELVTSRVQQKAELELRSTRSKHEQALREANEHVSKLSSELLEAQKQLEKLRQLQGDRDAAARLMKVTEELEKANRKIAELKSAPVEDHELTEVKKKLIESVAQIKGSEATMCGACLQLREP